MSCGKITVGVAKKFSVVFFVAVHPLKVCVTKAVYVPDVLALKVLPKLPPFHKTVCVLLGAVVLNVTVVPSQAAAGLTISKSGFAYTVKRILVSLLQFCALVTVTLYIPL